MKATHHLTATVDAHYSPDDEGWYLQDYETGEIGLAANGPGQFPTWQAARNALQFGKVEWA